MSTEQHPLRVTIAEEIRVLLARRRLSAMRLGVQIGRSQSYMSRRLTGDMPFDMDDLEAIARVLDVPITDLFAVTGQKPTENLAAAPVIRHRRPRRPRRPRVPFRARTRAAAA